jgi:tetratricopeptide (TPR) repeat protein
MKRIFVTVCVLLLLKAVSAQVPDDGIKQIDALKYDEARKTFTNLMAQEPTNADYNYYLGEVTRLGEDMTGALKLYNDGLGKNPKNALCLVGLGKSELAAKNLEGAKGYFNKALEYSKQKNVTVLLAISEALIDADTKDLGMAETLLNKAKDINEKNPEVYILLGDLFAERNDPQEPIKNYEMALSLNPKYAKAYMKKGLLFARARTKEAYQIGVEATQKGIEVDPEYAPLYAQMAEIYSLTKQYEKAKENYVKYLSLVNNDLYARVRYASFLYLSKDYTKAIEEIQLIHQKDQSRPFLFRLLGCSYYETGDSIKALENMDLFFTKQTDPKKIIFDDYKYYGQILSKLKRDSLAIESYKKALIVDPSKTELYGEMATVYSRSKKYTEAIGAYHTKLAAKDFYYDNFLLGKAYVFGAKTDSTRWDSAIATFDKCIQQKADWPYGYYWKARSYVNRDGKKDQKTSGDEAKLLYTKMLEITATDSLKYKKEQMEAYNFLGQYYYFRKSNAEAIEEFKKVLAIDPNDKTALEAKKVLKF